MVEQKKEVKVDEFFGAEAARKTVQEAMVRLALCSSHYFSSCRQAQRCLYCSAYFNRLRLSPPSCSAVSLIAGLLMLCRRCTTLSTCPSVHDRAVVSVRSAGGNKVRTTPAVFSTLDSRLTKRRAPAPASGPGTNRPVTVRTLGSTQQSKLRLLCGHSTKFSAAIRAHDRMYQL